MGPTNPYDPSAPGSVQATGGLTGRVERVRFDGERVPAAGASVRLTTDADAEVAQGTADEDGRYVFGDLVAGTYRIEATLQGHSGAAAIASIALGEDAQAGALLLTPLGASLQGVVQTSAPPRGPVTVVVRGDPGHPVTAEVGRAVLAVPGSGRFEVPDVPPGPYELTAVSEGFRPAEWSRA